MVQKGTLHTCPGGDNVAFNLVSNIITIILYTDSIITHKSVYTLKIYLIIIKLPTFFPKTLLLTLRFWQLKVH